MGGWRCRNWLHQGLFPDYDKQQLKEARWNPGLCDEGALGQRWARWSEEAERFLLSAAAAQPASAAAFKGRGAPLG